MAGSEIAWKRVNNPEAHHTGNGRNKRTEHKRGETRKRRLGGGRGEEKEIRPGEGEIKRKNKEYKNGLKFMLKIGRGEEIGDEGRGEKVRRIWQG